MFFLRRASFALSIIALFSAGFLFCTSASDPGGDGGSVINRIIPAAVTIASYDSGDQDGLNVLQGPIDLQFNPDPAWPNELWVVAQKTEGVLKITNPGTDDIEYEGLLDKNRSHFMAGASGIAFGSKPASEISATPEKYAKFYGDAYNFATSQDNNNGSDRNIFMGPVLWNANPDLFAYKGAPKDSSWGDLGSHTDMLHESPYSAGITHYQGSTFEDPSKNFTDNTFIVVDGNSKSLTLYDFMSDHGPGHDDHTDGVIRRFLKGEILPFSTNNKTRSGHPLFVGSGIVYDTEAKLVYVSDAGNGRVLVVDLKDATIGDEFDALHRGGSEPPNKESYRMCAGATFEVFASSDVKGFEDLSRPSGIATRDGEIAIADYETGNIYIADIKSSRVSNVIETEYENSIMGLEIGSDGALYVAAYKESEILRYEGLWKEKDAS